MLLSLAIEDYLKSLSGKNSVYTIKNYSKYLAKFLDFISNIEITHLTQERLDKYKNSLQLSRIKAATINLYLITLRSFVRYQIELGVDLSYLDIELEYQPARKIELLDRESIELILRAPDLSTPEGIRDKIVLELIILNGLKSSEITQLNRDITGLAESTNILINSYLLARKDNYLPLIIRFQGSNDFKENGEKMRLSQRSIERIIEKYTKLSGYENITANTLIVSARSEHFFDPGQYSQIQVLPG